MSNPPSAEARQARQLVTCPKCSTVTEVIQHRRETIPCGECKTEMPLAESYADLVAERDGLQAQILEATEATVIVKMQDNFGLSLVDLIRKLYGLWRGAFDDYRRAESLNRELHAELDLTIEKDFQLRTLNRGLVAERDKFERKYRERIWLNHGCFGMYGDDGEMQCNNLLRHGILDFKRDSVEKLEEALVTMNLKELGARAEAAINSATPKQGEGKNETENY